MPKCPRSSGPVRKELGCWTDIAALSLILRGRIFCRKTGVHFSGKCSISYVVAFSGGKPVSTFLENAPYLTWSHFLPENRCPLFRKMLHILRGRIFCRKTGVHFFGKCSICPACSSARHDGARGVRARRACELRIGRARGAHEGADLAGILLPRRALDAGGYIDAVRPRDAQCLLDIAGIKPAREHERHRQIEVLQEAPIE